MTTIVVNHAEYEDSTDTTRPAAFALSRRLTILVTTLVLALLAVASPLLTNAAHAATGLSTTTTNSWAYKMLGALNNERKANHLPPLSMNAKLRSSAHVHNLHMTTANAMSHQLKGETDFSTRISRAGYNWRAAGENIGWTSDLTLQGLYNLQHTMYIEHAPNNGHRLNILSRSYTNIGIDVYYDAHHHKMWFTQDLAQPM
jgi:uncharacterized protein YkwD